jgi:hypothetical protein
VVRVVVVKGFSFGVDIAAWQCPCCAACCVRPAEPDPVLGLNAGVQHCSSCLMTPRDGRDCRWGRMKLNRHPLYQLAVRLQGSGLPFA